MHGDKVIERDCPQYSAVRWLEPLRAEDSRANGVRSKRSPFNLTKFLVTERRGQACDSRARYPTGNFLLLTPPSLTQSRRIGTPPLPEQIELHRDRMWRGDEDLNRVTSYR